MILVFDDTLVTWFFRNVLGMFLTYPMSRQLEVTCWTTKKHFFRLLWPLFNNRVNGLKIHKCALLILASIYRNYNGIIDLRSFSIEESTLY